MDTEEAYDVKLVFCPLSNLLLNFMNAILTTYMLNLASYSLQKGKFLLLKASSFFYETINVFLIQFFVTCIIIGDLQLQVLTTRVVHLRLILFAIFDWYLLVDRCFKHSVAVPAQEKGRQANYSTSKSTNISNEDHKGVGLPFVECFVLRKAQLYFY